MKNLQTKFEEKFEEFKNKHREVLSMVFMLVGGVVIGFALGLYYCS